MENLAVMRSMRMTVLRSDLFIGVTAWDKLKGKNNKTSKQMQVMLSSKL